MFELTEGNAPACLEGRGFAGPWQVSALGGGVSNTVLLAESASLRLVLKQSLPKLRVEQDWFSDRRRILREADALRRLSPVLGPDAVPEVLFEDRENCLYAMSAAPAGARTWKDLLLAGEIDPAAGARIGAMLNAMVRASWHNPAWEEAFGDQTVFDQLRLDPYYRTTAARHPDLARHFQALVERSPRDSLVHGDWSPKNFLLAGGCLVAIDFEVIHFGDPCFDTGFLLNHLLLKSFYRPHWRDRYAATARAFWEAFAREMPGRLEAGTLAHLGGLLLARIDGKSPAEYIQNPELKAEIRAFARDLIERPPARLAEIFAW